MHMYAKYQVSICNGSKVMVNVKVALKQTNKRDKQTNKQTDRAKIICPPDLIWGAKKNCANYMPIRTYANLRFIYMRVFKNFTSPIGAFWY